LLNLPCRFAQTGHAGSSEVAMGGGVKPADSYNSQSIGPIKELFRLRDSLGPCLVAIYLFMACCYREYAIYIVDGGL